MVHFIIMDVKTFPVLYSLLALTNGITEKYRKIIVQANLIPGDEILMTETAENAIECCTLCTQTPECGVSTYDMDSLNCELIVKPWMQYMFEDAPTKTYFVKDFGMILTVLNPITWEAAKQQCKDRGGRLLQIESEHKMTHWKAQMKLFTEYLDSWIGLSDMDTENDFKWADGSALTITPDWTSNFSTEHGTKDCVYTSKTLAWDVLSCSMALPYTCEFVL